MILGAFTLILWDLVLRGRGRGWLRVVAVVVGAPACALAATVISAGVGWAVAATLEPDEPPPPAHTEQTTPENRERTSPAEVRGPRRPPSGVRPPPPRLRLHPRLRLQPRLRPHLRPSNVRVVRQCDEHPSRITCTLGGSVPSSCPYSPECVEEEFCELRHNGVLRSSALPLCPGAHTLPSDRSMLPSLRGQLTPREGAGQLPALLLDQG